MRRGSHAREAVSLLGRFAARETSRAFLGARRRFDQVVERVLGADFEERVHELRLHIAGRGGDPFGLDPERARQAVKVCAFFHRLYFRTAVEGLEHLPTGRALLIANHSGQVPIDAAIIGTALFLDATPPRFMRAMVDRWADSLPWISTFFPQVGQVVGERENARCLLEREELVLTFPEGTRGISKPFSKRYQLEEFGHGFASLAIELETPVVPVAVIGAEEQYISFGNLEWAARALGMPAFPLVPQLLLPGGQMPLPTRYRLYFGEPIWLTGDPTSAEEMAGQALSVRRKVQAMLEAGLRRRDGIFR